MTSKKRDSFYLSMATIIAILLIAFGLCWPLIYEKILHDNLVIKPGSKSYQNWIRTPLPMYLDIYLFNVTNSVEFLSNKNVTLKVEEVGPFIFREIHDRVNITFNEDGTVSYNQTRNWTFVAEGSIPLDVKITNLNAIALGVAHATRYSNSYLQHLIDPILRTFATVFVTRPAEEWLFKGMDLLLLDLLNSKTIKKYIPFDIPADKFGFFYNRNMSAAYDGHFEVYSGQHSLTEVGNMVAWNGMNQTSFFKDYCAMVNGSAGEIFPQNDGETFDLFISDVCRFWDASMKEPVLYVKLDLQCLSLKLKFAGSVNVDKIKGRQYVGDETMFDNGQNVPNMACFCEGECVPAGARNMTKCRQGAPVFVSYPHFYLADPSYGENVEGLSPNKSLHEFQLTLEPTTGIPLDVRAKLQVNLLLQSYPRYKMYKTLPRVFVPQLWFNQRAHITGNLVSQTSLLITLRSISAIPFSLAVLALVTVAVKLVKRYRQSKREEDTEILVENEVVEN